MFSQQQLQTLIDEINQQIITIQKFTDFDTLINSIKTALFDTLGNTTVLPISDLLKKILGLNLTDLTNELITLTRIFAFLEANNAVKAIFIASNTNQPIDFDFLSKHIETEKEGKDRNAYVIKQAKRYTHPDGGSRLFPPYVIEKLVKAFQEILRLDPTQEAEEAEQEDTHITAATKKRWEKDIGAQHTASVAMNKTPDDNLTFEDWLLFTDEEKQLILKLSTAEYKNAPPEYDYTELGKGDQENVRTLHRAIHENNLHQVKELLDSGVNIEGTLFIHPKKNYRNPESQTPLFIALHKKQYAIAQILLKGGAKYNIVHSYGSHIFFELDEIGLKLVFRQLFLDIRRDNPLSDIELYRTVIETILNVKDSSGRPFINIVRDQHILNRLDHRAKDRLLRVFSPFLTLDMLTAGKDNSFLQSVTREQGCTEHSISTGARTISALTVQRQVQTALALEYSRIAAATATSLTNPETAIVLAPAALVTTPTWRAAVDQFRELVVTALVHSNFVYAKSLLLMDSTLLDKREQGYNPLEAALVVIIETQMFPPGSCSFNSTTAVPNLFGFICTDLLMGKTEEEQGKFCAMIFSNIIVSGNPNLQTYNPDNPTLAYYIKNENLIENALEKHPEVYATVQRQLKGLLESVANSYKITPYCSGIPPFFAAFRAKFFGEDKDRKTLTAQDKQALILQFSILANLDALATTDEQHAVVCSFLTSAVIQQLVPRNNITVITSLPNEAQCEILRAMGSFYVANFPLQQSPSNTQSLQDRFIGQLLILKKNLEADVRNHSLSATIRGIPGQLKAVKLLVSYLACLREAQIDDGRLSALFESGLFETVAAALATPKLPLRVQSAIAEIIKNQNFEDFAVMAITGNTVRQITITNGDAAPPTYENATETAKTATFKK